MSAGLLGGLIATGVALVVFLLWTFRELRRVDRYAPPDTDRESEERPARGGGGAR